MSRPLKLHAYSPAPEHDMPGDLRDQYHAQNLRGTKCGYMRHVTHDLAAVPHYHN